MNQPSDPTRPALIEDDVPVRRRSHPPQLPDHTQGPVAGEIDDAVTRGWHAPTTMLPRDPPAPIGPTENVEAPTSLLPSAERSGAAQVAGLPDAARLGAAVAALRVATETLEVDGRRLIAQALGGILAALTGSVPTGSLERAICRIGKELLLVDAGIGGRFGDDELARLLIEVATGVLVGIDPYRKASLDLAERAEARCKAYKAAAEGARIAGAGHEAKVLVYEACAAEMEAEVIELRRAAR